MLAPPDQTAEKSCDCWRLWLFRAFIAAVFVTLGLRLWFLQIAKGADYLEQSLQNHLSQVEIPTTRGLLTDRDGRVLVDNEVGYELRVTPNEVKEPAALAAQVAGIVGLSADDLEKKFKAFKKQRPFSPNVWVAGLSRADLALVESRRWQLDGLSVQTTSVRRPLLGAFAPHVIGYLGQINQAQLAGGDYPEVRQGELVGQSGLEQSLERFLHGRKGNRQMTVDSKGRVLQELSVEYPRPGHNIRLTLDSRLQRVAQSLLAEQAGAVVVMDPRNFEILAMASSPMFNLEDFVGGISAERWRSLNEDPFTPMQNRAVSGQYSPGSTFKIAVSLAALYEGVITPETIFHCGGQLTLGAHPFRCWNRSGHGAVNLHRSLKESCDIYYYEVGRRIGVDRLAVRVRRFFGLGRPTGVELRAEQPGLVPDQAWKMRRYGRPWTTGDTVTVAIGQGNLLTTPLQVAQYTAVVANGGTLYRPRLVKEIVDFEGKLVQNSIPEPLGRLEVKPDHLSAVKRGLEAVVNEPGGSGWRAKLPDIVVAGKTGTTQTVSLQAYQSYNASNRPYRIRDHAWFTAYAPADNPEVVVTVLLEHSGGGGARSAPLAAKIINAYFDKSIDTNLMPPFQVQPDKPIGWQGEL
ncbi:MAG: penicillin-binding protein 2 [Deltaproteobacteria bacterium]|jgi:penicillin-binding protein 2|nr:penicillin-binding protein 2 [Deltaproteobacteria bacterium]